MHACTVSCVPPNLVEHHQTALPQIECVLFHTQSYCVYILASLANLNAFLALHTSRLYGLYGIWKCFITFCDAESGAAACT